MQKADKAIGAEEIQKLKKERKAVILAHLYQWPEVQDIADFTGDSLELSKKAQKTEAEVIVFCGVRFMGETAKILNPEKTVLMPASGALCPMADMVTRGDVEELRRLHPKAAVVCYVNSSASVKAASDVCCTSSNAVAVAGSLPQEEIIFVPDENLGRFAQSRLPHKKFIFFPGFCPTHRKITPQDVAAARAARPGAEVLVHPECREEVVTAADFIGSTAQIIEYAAASHNEEFLIGTEMGVLHRLHRLCPEKRFYSLRSALVCPNMKKTALADVKAALETLRHPIELERDLMERAAVSLRRMLSL